MYLWELLVHVSGNFVLNSKKESVLHWACKGQEKNEELLIFLVDKWVVCDAIRIHAVWYFLQTVH